MIDDYSEDREIADIRRDVSELKGARVTYKDATVTAVDAVSSTFTADIPGAGTIEGLSAPRQFLPAVGDLVRLTLNGASPTYQPHRIGEGAVGTVELADEVNETIQTALDTANGKNTVTFSILAPTIATPGKRVDDQWHQLVDSVLVGSWRWDGDSWEPHKYGDEVLDTLTAAKITSGQIAVGVSITIGDPLGDRTVIDDQRVAFLSEAPDGTDIEVARFGRQQGGTDPTTGQQTWSIDEKGDASFQDLSVNGDPIIMGTPFSEHIGGLSGGFHAGASIGALTDPAQTPAGGGEVGLYEFAVECDPGEVYWLLSSNFWVRPSSSTTTRIDVNLRYTVSADPAVAPAPVTVASPLYARWGQQIDSGGTLGHGVVLSRLIRRDAYFHYRFLISIATYGGAGYIEMGSGNSFDATIGATIEPDGVQVGILHLGNHPWTNRAALNAGSTGGGTSPSPVKRYTTTYYPHWTRRFRGDNSVWGDGGLAVQGYTPNYPANGDQKSMIGDFRKADGTTGLAADLAGATIEKFEVYLYAKSWHYASGGTALIKYHNNVGPGPSWANVAGSVTVPGWARGQGRWVDITSWGNAFRDGGAKGIVVGPSGGTDPIYYGTYDGHAGSHPPLIRATFTK